MKRQVYYLYIKETGMKDFKGFNLEYGIYNDGYPSAIPYTKENIRKLKQFAAQNFNIEGVQLRDIDNHIVFNY